MEFKVSGLTFTKEELKKVTLASLEVGSISSSHLFLLTPRAAFLVLSAGDIISSEFIQKYKERGLESFSSLEVYSDECYQKYESSFSKLLEAKDEITRQICAQAIVKEFMSDFWHSGDESILVFVKICFEKFFFLEQKHIEKMNEQSLVLYSRGLLASSFGVINCLINRIVDSYFLKDLYNATLMMDYGLLTDDKLSYSIIKACENERAIPGTGIEYLDIRNRPYSEKEIYLNHPKLSAQFLETLKHRFFNKEIIDIILFHHENSDGSGFPFKIPYSAMTDMETFITFSDQCIPFNEHQFVKGDGEKVLKIAFDSLRQSCSDLPIQRIMNQFSSAAKWSSTEPDKEVS